MLCDVPAMSITLDWRLQVSANKGIKQKKPKKRGYDYDLVYKMYLEHKTYNHVGRVLGMEASTVRYCVLRYIQDNNL